LKERKVMIISQRWKINTDERREGDNMKGT
jgi:hypothetical protein